MKTNIITKTSLTLASAVLFLSTPAIATPSNASVEKLAAATNYEGLFYEEVITPLAMRRIQLIQSLQADKSLTDKQREDALKTFDTYAENLVAKIETPEMNDKLKTAYIASAKANFTQAEVDAQVAFYGSASGKSSLQKRDTVFAQFLQATTADVQSIVSTYEEANLAKMEADMKRILGK
ncbi:MAG: DUF2059 domain-containing protein [Moraxella sp.]|nr:DUF2059 domain-containing protein [Moraxella sp.]